VRQEHCARIRLGDSELAKGGAGRGRADAGEKRRSIRLFAVVPTFPPLRGLTRSGPKDDSVPRGSAAKKKVATQWRNKREDIMGWLIPGAMVAMVVILAVTLTRL
jgi:hypothetical protein